VKSFADKVVVITGAGSGIGRALARNLAGRGALLALSDVDEAGLAETASLLGAAKVRTDRLDVRDRQAMASYAASVAAEFGTVNVIINNAGVALTGSIADMTYADMEWILDIDFWGVVNGTKEFLPYLIRSGDAHIVNLSSLFGLLGVPGQSAYNAAKFAVRGFTESLRQEMVVAKLPVQVTSVHPGGIKTAIARNARVAEGEDQAALADFFDRKLAKLPPERAAEIIVNGMLANKGRVIIGADAKFLNALQLLLGWRYQNVVANIVRNRVPQRKAALR
jgi:NADP-dependent 3-hydroxy acid dehydrogenase YdfG